MLVSLTPAPNMAQKEIVRGKATKACRLPRILYLFSHGDGACSASLSAKWWRQRTPQVSAGDIHAVLRTTQSTTLPFPRTTLVFLTLQAGALIDSVPFLRGVGTFRCLPEVRSCSSTPAAEDRLAKICIIEERS